MSMFRHRIQVRMAATQTEEQDLVIRAGYGTFSSSFRGNISASAVVGPPYWTYETQSWTAAQLQRWETAWPVNPNSFVAPGISAPAYNINPIVDHEWNVSVQKSLPFKTAVTVSYVGSSGDALISENSLNEVTPGLYTTSPGIWAFYPAFGSIDLYQNTGHNWYNSGQLKLERRFSGGLSFMLSYAYSKNMSENGADGIWSTFPPLCSRGFTAVAFRHSITPTFFPRQRSLGHSLWKGACLGRQYESGREHANRRMGAFQYLPLLLWRPAHFWHSEQHLGQRLGYSA